jgi:hypothetical protein
MLLMSQGGEPTLLPIPQGGEPTLPPIPQGGKSIRLALSRRPPAPAGFVTLRRPRRHRRSIVRLQRWRCDIALLPPHLQPAHLSPPHLPSPLLLLPLPPRLPPLLPLRLLRPLSLPLSNPPLN